MCISMSACENSICLLLLPQVARGSREWPGCGTRRCLSQLHQPLFLLSALRLRRARRREICCSSLRKFTPTATWVLMWVKVPLCIFTTPPLLPSSSRSNCVRHFYKSLPCQSRTSRRPLPTTRRRSDRIRLTPPTTRIFMSVS